MSNFYIELLDRNRHNLQTFQSGKPRLDAILHDPTQLHEYGKTYVVVSKPGSRKILACFTLLPDPQDIVAEDEIAVEFTAVLLNLLAVDHHYQRRGIGKWILSQLMRDMVQVSESHPLDYLLVEPLDEEARGYYQHLDMGFVTLSDGKLVLSVETMRQAVKSAT